MATFKAIIDKTRMREDKTWRVFIQVIHNRKKRLIGTQLYVSTKQINARSEIKDKNVIAQCDEIIVVYRRKIASLELDLFPRDINYIVDFLTSKQKSESEISFSSYFEEWKKGHVSLKGMKNYQTAFNAFVGFFGRKEISATDVNVKTLRAFCNTLSDRPRAASLYCSSIVRVFNDMRDFYNEDENNPVIKHSLRKFVSPRQEEAEQRGLPADTIRKIFALPYKDKVNGYINNRYNLALDCFKLSFCLMGMNAVDLYNAERLENDTIIYERTKTRERRRDKATMEVVINPTIKDLVARYRGNKRVFSFCERFTSPVSFTRSINIGLKAVGNEVGVPNLQFYAARHSFASIAYNDVGVPMSIVDEMLCHKGMDMRITKLYIKKDFSHINEANSKLIAWMFGENA